ncbi:hypothetical protein [Burkholderia sp. LMU1-1-1.1]|jgi:hypothetical protein|uniref:hypothetical protein n=1 Tax=Burkholderia sp. LMU1-1-1.1 TaxID=3135266 RepID=UPI003415260F
MSSDTDPKPPREPQRDRPDLPKERGKSERRRLKAGTELAAFGRLHGGIDLKNLRDQTPPEPAEVE